MIEKMRFKWSGDIANDAINIFADCILNSSKYISTLVPDIYSQASNAKIHALLIQCINF